MITLVGFARRAEKDLKKLPKFIIARLFVWVKSIEEYGLEETRKIPGLHDEALKGQRRGQRSIRLNRSYRAIYEIKENDQIEFVEIQEVNNHEY